MIFLKGMETNSIMKFLPKIEEPEISVCLTYFRPEITFFKLSFQQLVGRDKQNLNIR
jgi:hypothetical protein